MMFLVAIFVALVGCLSLVASGSMVEEYEQTGVERKMRSGQRALVIGVALVGCALIIAAWS